MTKYSFPGAELANFALKVARVPWDLVQAGSRMVTFKWGPYVIQVFKPLEARLEVDILRGDIMIERRFFLEHKAWREVFSEVIDWAEKVIAVWEQDLGRITSDGPLSTEEYLGLAQHYISQALKQKDIEELPIEVVNSLLLALSKIAEAREAIMPSSEEVSS